MINLSMFIATVIVLVCVLLSDATKAAKQAEESLVDLYYNETSEESDGNGFNTQIGFTEQVNSAKHRSADPIIATSSSMNDTIATKSSAPLESQAKGRQGVTRSCAHHIPPSEKPLYFWEQVNNTGWPYHFVGKDNTTTTIDYIEDEASKNTTTVVVFVKFHKVASTMMACDILKHLQQSRANDNFYLCASHFCSLSVARSLHRAVSRGFHKSNHTIRIQKRNALLAGTTEWIGPGGRQPIVFPTLSSGQLQSRLNIKFMTILRHPIERIRSKYYFRREGWCKEKKEGCLATKLTFLEWLNYYEHRNSTKDEMEICCEYTRILGGTITSVDEALRALELFDVLAFTEQYDESSSEVAEALGLLDYNETTVSMRNNTSAKKPWSAEERAVAERITAGDMVVYNTALSMMMTRLT